MFPLQILFEVQALSNFVAEEEGDLGFKVREILAILESRFGRETANVINVNTSSCCIVTAGLGKG